MLYELYVKKKPPKTKPLYRFKKIKIKNQKTRKLRNTFAIYMADKDIIKTFAIGNYK